MLARTRLALRLYSLLGGARFRRTFERPYLALFFAYKRFAEDPFAALVAKRPDLFRGGEVIDVGANVGYTAIVFAAALDRGRRVFALEPEPENFAIMQRVIARRALEEKIVALRVAAGDHIGEAELAINPTHPGDHHIARGISNEATINVPLTTVDELAFSQKIDRVSFVKIDVQGLELAVSRGMHRLLAENESVCVAFEYTESSARDYGYGMPELFGFYTARQFAIFLLTRDGELHDATAESIAEAARARGYVDLLAMREARR
jgi:FkbM family methyltransferase